MSDNPKSIVQRFVSFCVMVLVGILAIWLALDVLSRIWGWLVLIAVIGALAFAGYLFARRRWNRW